MSRTADVRYHSGPDENGVFWVQVGSQTKLRPVALNPEQCLEVAEGAVRAGRRFIMSGRRRRVTGRVAS